MGGSKKIEINLSLKTITKEEARRNWKIIEKTASWNGASKAEIKIKRSKEKIIGIIIQKTINLKD